ncbi:hypothetical protein D3C72_2242710 [compost metagenome]
MRSCLNSDHTEAFGIAALGTDWKHVHGRAVHGDSQFLIADFADEVYARPCGRYGAGQDLVRREHSRAQRLAGRPPDDHQGGMGVGLKDCRKRIADELEQAFAGCQSAG